HGYYLLAVAQRQCTLAGVERDGGIVDQQAAIGRDFDLGATVLGNADVAFGQLLAGDVGGLADFLPQRGLGGRIIGRRAFATGGQRQGQDERDQGGDKGFHSVRSVAEGRGQRFFGRSMLPLTPV